MAAARGTVTADAVRFSLLYTRSTRDPRTCAPPVTAAVLIGGPGIAFVGFDNEGDSRTLDLSSGRLVRAVEHPGFPGFGVLMTRVEPHEDSESAGKGYTDGDAEFDRDVGSTQDRAHPTNNVRTSPRRRVERSGRRLAPCLHAAWKHRISSSRRRVLRPPGNAAPRRYGGAPGGGRSPRRGGIQAGDLDRLPSP